MKTQREFLDNRAQIDALKGILILVIVAGHNEGLMNQALDVRQLFYYFNVQCFFMLSFILPGRACSLPFLRDRGVRYLVPYVLFTGLAGVIYMCLPGAPTSISQGLGSFALALGSGNASLLNQAVGLQLFWFLPSLFSLVILRSCWIALPRGHYGFAAVVALWMLFGALLPETVHMVMPLGLSPALFLFLPCMLCATLFQYILSKKRMPLVGGVAVLLSISLAAWIVMANLGWVAGASMTSYSKTNLVTYGVALLFPLVAFFALYWIAGYLSWIKVLVLCGQFSLIIYLLHVFIYRGLTLAFYGREFTNLSVVGAQPIKGALIFVLTVLISLVASGIIIRVPRLNRFLFPRDWDDWRATFRKSKEAAV